MGSLRGTQEVPVNIVGSSTFGLHPKISCAKTYNMYISDEWLVNYPGYRKVLEIVSDDNAPAEGRGVFKSTRGDLMIVVINSTVWRISESLDVIFIGNIDTSSGPVFMDENLNSQICIVDGLNAYIFSRITLALTEQTLNASLLPKYVKYHNTYFLFGNGDITGNGAKWFAYSRATDNTITETYELALQTKPDYAIAVVPLPDKGNNVLVLGNSVAEIQNNVGGLQGYKRVSSININYGCLNVATIATTDKYTAWLAINEDSAPVIMVLSGKDVQTLSTDGINHVLGKIKHPEDAAAFFYKIDGHIFYQITFAHPDDNLTLAHDFNTGKFYHLSDHNLDYHVARQIVYINNRTYFVSINNGCLYQTSVDFHTYDENITNPFHKTPLASYDQELNREIPQFRICDNIRLKTSFPFLARRFYFTLEQGADNNYTELGFNNDCSEAILTEAGEAILTEDGQPIVTEAPANCLLPQPRVDFSFSKDGGVTFSQEVGRVMNFSAHRQNMMSWERFGKANEFTVKVKFWGHGRFVASNGVLEITG